MTEKTTEFRHSIEKSHVCFHLRTKNLADIIYSSWEKEPYRLKLVIIGHFLAFCSHKNQKKSKLWKKKGKNLGNIIILHMCTKNHNHMMYGSCGTEWDRQNFLLYWTIFCFFTPLTIHKIKILKKWKKNNWGYYWFTLKHHKWQSYHVWFLKHGGQQIYIFFVILDHFLHFSLFNNLKNQNFEKLKKYLEILSFYTLVYYKWKS